MRRWIAPVALATSLGMALAACAGGTSTGGGDGGGVRDIEIAAMDDLRYDPMTVSVAAGEEVRFVMTNAGSMAHEFIVGDDAVQMEHEGQMGSGGSMDHGAMDLPSLKLDPGETQSATVTFDEPGTLKYGCHVPGHYAGGMVGTIEVT